MNRDFNIITAVSSEDYPYFLSFLGSFFYHHRRIESGAIFIHDELPPRARNYLSSYEALIFLNKPQDTVIAPLRNERFIFYSIFLSILRSSKAILERTSLPLYVIDSRSLFASQLSHMGEGKKPLIFYDNHRLGYSNCHARKLLPLLYFPNTRESILLLEKIILLTELESNNLDLSHAKVIAQNSRVSELFLALDQFNLGGEFNEFPPFFCAFQNDFKGREALILHECRPPVGANEPENYRFSFEGSLLDTSLHGPSHGDFLARERWLTDTLYPEKYS